MIKRICKKTLLSIFLIFSISRILNAQEVDLSSVDAYFKVVDFIKGGKDVPLSLWQEFDSSACYKEYVKRKNPFVINSIKETMKMVFSDVESKTKDSILNISSELMKNDLQMMFKKQLLKNYLDVKQKYDSLKFFRNNYDFVSIVKKARQRLGSFLGVKIDSTVKLKPVYFLFITKDGAAKDNAIYIDFNMFYTMDEASRINFIAHEFFHVYREKFENHDFNYKCDLFRLIDNFQNEGIADLIDKSEGYEKFFTKSGYPEKVVEIWVDEYNNAEKNLATLQDIILEFSKNEISENELIKKLLNVVKFNGHPIGFYMANQIVKAGYREKMIKNFYNPYQFFVLYNKAAEKLNLFKLNDEFMNYLKKITKDYYG